MEKFVIVDGNSLINRAFYAMPPLKSLSGKPSNAIFGFLNMILSVVTNEKPKYFVCVFDAGKHNFRHDMYAEYKAGRDKMPEDLHSQLLDLKEILKTMGVKVIEKNEIEADDIIGSLTRKFNEEFILLSGDKDLLQLINDNTTVWLTQKGISNVNKVDEKVLKTEFNLKPFQVIELKSIMGDSSDNIPGVPGIGKVGAEKLLAEYEDLDNVYKNIEKLPKGMQEKLNKNKELAYLSHKLATIKLDVDIDCSLDECEFKLPLNAEVYSIFKEYDFKSFLNRKELFDSVCETKEVKEVQMDIVEVDSQEKFDNMLNSLKDSISVVLSDMFLNISNRDKEFVIYVNGDLFNKNLDAIRKLFASNMEKICFDAKQLMHDLEIFDIEINNYFDISLAIYIANELEAEIKLNDALKLNNIETNSYASSLFVLKEIYVNKLISGMQLKLYNEIELPLVKVLFEMEKFGIPVNVEQIKILSRIYHEELKDVTAKIYELTNEQFNINSPKQLQDILFNKLKIEYKGKLGTSVEVLNEIEDKHPIVPLILRYRKISKLISTYLDGMLNYVENDNKIHTTFMQRTTSTGRLSSREPNLQNLPIRDDEGKQLRKMFTSSFDGGTIISADYNQIELRLMANFSADENMIADYLNGKDIHTATASKIFGVKIDEVSPQMRRVAKSVNFGIIYGISAYGLSLNIHSSTKEAAAFIKKYMEIYPKIQEYGAKCIEEARKVGYVKTFMGRIRHIPDINSGNHVMRSFAERVAKNMPLQGSASDIIKIAMIRVFKKFEELKLKSKLILQIHDELVVDCFPGESEKVKDILKEEMEGVVSLKVPLLVEVSEGATLYDAK